MTARGRAPLILACLGALGAVAADWLLYPVTTSGAGFKETMAGVVARQSEARLAASGLLAPLNAGLMLLGLAHVAGRALPPARPLARAALGLSALAMLFAVALHATWTPYALALKACGGQAAGQPLVASIRGFMRSLFAALLPLAFLGTGLLGALIAAGRTAYPRWLACFSLPIPLLALRLLAPFVPAPFGGLAAGVQLSLSALVFFLAALAASRAASEGSPSPGASRGSPAGRTALRR